MFHFPLVRTVVNLSLIVAMTIQPGMAYVVAKDCGADCAAIFMCEGCGCCEVSSPAARCCCCGGGPQSDGHGDCCGGSMESMTSATPSSDTIEIKVVVINTTTSSVEHAANGDQPADDQLVNELSSACHCGFESQPIGDSVPVRPSVERRDYVTVRFSDLATIFDNATGTPRRIEAGQRVSLLSHFSQIQLCIWRL